MKIVITGAAQASAIDSDKKITDPALLQKLDGLDFSKDRCSNYFDRSLEDIGIVGGVVRLAFDQAGKHLRVVTEYHSPRRLEPAELAKLVDETEGQWSDGIGEGDFLHRKKLKMDVSIAPQGRPKPRAE